MARRRFVAAYLVLECYTDAKLPIKSVAATSVCNASAVATVHMHPNPYLHKLTRGVNVFVVCQTAEYGVDTGIEDKIMFIGDVSSVQVTNTNGQADYILNLVDNRRYLAELPTFYLQLMRDTYEYDKHVRTKGGQEILSFADQIADANFYGIAGSYLENTFFYDIEAVMGIHKYMDFFIHSGLGDYITKMMEPLLKDTGWEPYYINMQMKKRIIETTYILDNGMFHSDIMASLAEEATKGLWHSTRNAHAELHTTYTDALKRLAQIGYVYNTALFPGSAGKRRGLSIPDKYKTAQEAIEYVKSLMFDGELLQVYAVYEDGRGGYVAPKADKGICARTGQNGVLDANAINIYQASMKQGAQNVTIYALVAGDPRMEQFRDTELVHNFHIIPKMYGVMPPSQNWCVLSEGISFNCNIAEPPITALKYNLTDGYSGASVFCCAVPEVNVDGSTEKRKALQIYSYQMSQEQEAVMVPGATTTPLYGAKLVIMPGLVPGGDAKSHAARDSFNGGTDLMSAGGKAGVPCISWTGGKVVRVEEAAPGWGKLVVIETLDSTPWRRPYWWYYAHLENTYVKVGATIKEGQVIGEIGNTGNTASNTPRHLHFSINIPKLTKKGYVASNQWVNTSRIISGYSGTWDNMPSNIVNVDLADMTDTVFAPRVQPVADSGTNTTGVTLPDTTEWRLLYPKGHHFPDEDIYGIKRVSKKGEALYELEKASQFAEYPGDEKNPKPSISADDKFQMLRAKTIQDFHEARVSQNTARLSFEGLNEYVSIGLPYLVYDDQVNIFYYGFVQEVSHRVDNSAGSAYTEIALTGVTTARSIKEIEDKFKGYQMSAYTVSGGGLKYSNANKGENRGNLDRVYGQMGYPEVIREQYNLMNLEGHDGGIEKKRDTGRILGGDVVSRKEQLRQIMSYPYRHICTLQEAIGFYYRGSKFIGRHNSVASAISDTYAWITDSMRNTINDILAYYRASLMTAIASPGVDIDDDQQNAVKVDTKAPVAIPDSYRMLPEKKQDAAKK